MTDPAAHPNPELVPMDIDAPVEPVEPNPVADAFYSGALTRITRLVPMLGIIAAVALAVRFGWVFGLGFVAGAAIACVNFYWLKRVVSALAEISAQDRRGVGRAAVIRFLLRYGVIIIAAYVILNISERALYGMFAGLFLPVAAIVCEAAYEVYVALRRGL
jgi:hypothetical protein